MKTSTSTARVDLDESVRASFRAHLKGPVHFPGQEDYVAARQMWNAAIDRRPSAILTCADAEDVSTAVRIASDAGLSLTIRGGGHNVGGRSIRESSLLLDLSKLRTVSVNRSLRIATAQGGALWRDVDGATAPEGLATTGGLVSTTGIGGFTLGGGAGWLMRRYGLACDCVRSANIVLADGRFVQASANEHPELFWGLRGGAGGLGVVTSFNFELFPLREVVAGLIVYPAEHALTVLRAFRDYAAGAPDEFCAIAVIAHAPPLPFLDSAWHGRPVVIVGVCWCGAPEIAERAMAPLVSHGSPLAVHVGPLPYVQWQQLLDPGAPSGRHNYWKTANFTQLGEPALEQLAAAALALPSPLSEIHLQHMGGAVARVPTADSAFAHRNVQFFVNFIGVTTEPDRFATLRDDIRMLHGKIHPYSSTGALTNFSDADEDEVSRFGPANATRLAALRRQYDPHGTIAS